MLALDDEVLLVGVGALLAEGAPVVDVGGTEDELEPATGAVTTISVRS